ncbi:hypothetical protein HB991_19785 [Yersinia mollaretii]|uniref:Secreted protein n=1 Tax=Yersinia mollaretii TaxID=33060 RepID=A0AA44CPW5_YERMO|nr:hypothetical protein [Yersinia mollaretii]NIL24743.1 hypothetical protein [Yersinia mollaretii]CNJ37945.1 Uncharacterised protein [Yersinia mollaretii]CNL01254.1 Uncharacterised protein [Yersinia mollaretii]CQQ86906.1 Uncharacterised protein [Yersinia mollaretii]
MNMKYLKLIPAIALMASAIFFASVRPSLAQIPTYYHDIVSENCELDPGSTLCDPGPVFMNAERLTDVIPTQADQLQFLSPPPIQW